MKRTLLTLSALLALAATVLWLASGRNLGWTKTSFPVKTVDEVTGLEAIDYQRGFSPGVDLLAIGLAGAGALAASSLLFRSKRQINQN